MTYSRTFLGILRFIPNLKRHRFGAKNFYAVLVEDRGTLIPLLLTHRQMMVAAKRAKKNPEDLVILQSR